MNDQVKDIYSLLLVHHFIPSMKYFEILSFGHNDKMVANIYPTGDETLQQTIHD